MKRDQPNRFHAEWHEGWGGVELAAIVSSDPEETLQGGP